MKTFKRALAALLCVCLLWTAGLAVISHAAEEYPPIDVEKVTLNEHTLTLNYGAKYSFKMTYSPGNSTNAQFVWTSSNDKLAKVDGSGNVTIAAATDTTSDFPQTVTITVAVKDDTRIKDSCVITVSKDISPLELIGRIFNSIATLFTTFFTNRETFIQTGKMIVNLIQTLLGLVTKAA